MKVWSAVGALALGKLILSHQRQTSAAPLLPKAAKHAPDTPVGLFAGAQVGRVLPEPAATHNDTPLQPPKALQRFELRGSQRRRIADTEALAQPDFVSTPDDVPLAAQRQPRRSRAPLAQPRVLRDDQYTQETFSRGRVDLVRAGHRGVGSELTVGQVLREGDFLMSSSGQFRLLLQADGDLSLSNEWGDPLWNTGARPGRDFRAVLRDDHAFAICDGENRTVWDTGPTAAGMQVKLQNDGDIVINDRSGTVVWTSDSGFPHVLPPPSDEPDGVIGGFGQGQIGDCWFLGALLAVNNDASGRFLIETSTRKMDADTWWVKTPGMRKRVEVTRSELESYTIDGNPLSHGDADVRLLEIAADKYDRWISSSLSNGGFPRRALRFFSGRSAYKTVGSVKRFVRRRLKRQYERFASDGAAFAFGNTIKDNSIGYPASHTGAVVKMDWERGKFFYVNPWNAERIRSAPIDDLVHGLARGELDVWRVPLRSLRRDPNYIRGCAVAGAVSAAWVIYCCREGRRRRAAAAEGQAQVTADAANSCTIPNPTPNGAPAPRAT